MRPRAPVALLLVAAAVVVAALTWWLAPGSATANAPLSSELAASVLPLPIERAPEADPHDARSTQPLRALATDGGLTDDQLFSHLKDPVNSDLQPALFTELSKLGAAIVRADATGRGREEWPGYWRTPAGRAEPCCDAIVVRSASADIHPSGDGTVQVIVLWGDVSARKSHRVSVVRLQPTSRGWQPAR